MRSWAIACLVAGAVVLAGCGTNAKQIPSGGPGEGAAVTSPPTSGVAERHTPQENRLLDEFFYSATQGAGQALNNRISYTRVTDRELLDGAVAFCGVVRTHPVTGQGSLSRADFDEAALQVAHRFDGKIETTSGDPAPDGPRLLARALGVAAVHKLCPDLARSLG
jgi:hypothetical protein